MKLQRMFNLIRRRSSARGGGGLAERFTRAQVIMRRADWLSAESGDDVVIMSVQTGKYVLLNETAAQAWSLLETPCRFDELTENLGLRFVADAESLRDDVLSLLCELHNVGAVECAP